MNLPPIQSRPTLAPEPAAAFDPPDAAGADELRDTFREFVGQTMFGSLMKSMRSTVGKPAYFHGGRGEEVFQQQLDARMVEHMTEASAADVADPMFELFQLQR